MFGDEILNRATWLGRLFSWWRYLTGRDRYYIGTDARADGDYWIKSVYDTKTGIVTVLEAGKDEPSHK